MGCQYFLRCDPLGFKFLWYFDYLVAAVTTNKAVHCYCNRKFYSYFDADSVLSSNLKIPLSVNLNVNPKRERVLSTDLLIFRVYVQFLMQDTHMCMFAVRLGLCVSGA